MKLTTTQITRIYFVFATLMLAMAACFNMRMMERELYGTNLWKYVTALVVMVWGGQLFKLVLPNYDFYKPTLPVTLFTLFFLWGLVPTAVSSSAPQKQMLFDLIWLMSPTFVLLSAYNTTRNRGTSKWYLAAFCMMAALFAALYVLIFREVNIFLENSHLIVSYFSLYALPLVFLCSSRMIKVVATIVVMVVIFTSLKRAGVVALVLALTLYIVLQQFIRDKIKATTIIGSLLTLLAFIALGIVFGSMGDEGNNMFERFENIDQDNGSGRTMVWGITLNMIEKSDIISLLIGHGYNTVVANSPINLSAHNDFLEVTYDYGLVGIMLYVSAIIVSLYYIVRMTREKSPYAPPLAMLFVIYLILSMISHVVIYYWINIVMLSVGFMLGNYQRDASKQ